MYQLFDTGLETLDLSNWNLSFYKRSFLLRSGQMLIKHLLSMQVLICFFQCSATIRQSSYQVSVSQCLGFVDLEPYPMEYSS